MAWLEFTIETTPQSIDSAVTALSARGFSDLVIEDQSEFETFLEENRAYWDYIDEGLQKKLEGLSRIKLYLEDTDGGGRKRLDAAVKELGLTMTAAPLPETNWEESWKDNYPPQEIGERIVVLPYWLAEESTDRLKVILDPGLTFGTGAHPSTQMVMEVMENVVKPGFHCLDLGSGSGILSIAALRLGAETAVGIDIDPDTFIARDLPHAPYWEQDGKLYGPDPWQVYPGDPHDHTGYGCYSPCIVKALNSALEHEGAADRFEVVDESGKTAAELCSYIDAGMPVVFWATLDFQPVPEKRDHWLLADGTDFAWKCNEHCLLLVGYDDENYWFNDPWHDHGVCPQPKQLVEDCHAAQGLFAVTLRPKGEA